MRYNSHLILFSVGLCVCILAMHAPAVAQVRSVDYRYAPSRYQTTICFPGDWQKTLVSNRGGLSYDFGPGPYAQPLTEITVGVKDLNFSVRSQTLADPRVPIVTTVLESGSIHIEEDAFAVATGHEESIQSIRLGRVRRLEGVSGTAPWGRPAPGIDTAFRSVAWGTGRPVVYLVDVARGSRWKVALGFIEPYKSKPGLRLLEARVEGAEPVTIDPMRDSVRNRPYVYVFDARDVNNGGELSIEVHPSPKTPDANVTLCCFWVFPVDLPVQENALIRGDLSGKAEVYYACGRELELSAKHPRVDAIRANISGTNQPFVVTIRSRGQMEFDEHTGLVLAGGKPFMLTRPPATAAARIGDTLQLTLPGDARTVEVIVAHGPASPTDLEHIPPLSTALDEAKRYWKSRKDLPFGIIHVPDHGIQSVLDANIRNLYQVSDVVDGHLQFQPGPTVYRGLWAADVLLSGMPLLMLGDNESERKFLETALAHQFPDGRISDLEPFLSIPETPVVVTAMCLFAQFSGDTDWLRSHWGAIEKGLSWVCMMHRRTGADRTSPWYELMPPGFVDGGVFTPTADYASVWWSLIAVEEVLPMASKLHITPDPAWKQMYDEISASYRLRSNSDMRFDLKGNPYLPISVGDTDVSNASRGQFAFLIPFRWGRCFLVDSAFSRPARATIAMLDASTEEGLVANSGWLHGGVWPWLGGVHGMAHTMLGDEEKAEDLLYSVANHAAPTGVWVEEQQARKYGTGTAGDVSDAEASAVFVSQVRDMIAQERGDTLHILNAIPREWLVPGASVSIAGGGSLFGPLTIDLHIDQSGRSGDLDFSGVNGRGARGGVIVHLGALAGGGFKMRDGSGLPASITLPWKRPLHLSFRY